MWKYRFWIYTSVILDYFASYDDYILTYFKNGANDADAIDKLEKYRSPTTYALSVSVHLPPHAPSFLMYFL